MTRPDNVFPDASVKVALSCAVAPIATLEVVGETVTVATGTATTFTFV
jgi:hypothetical protein